MTFREWLALPVSVLAWFCEDGGEWLANKLGDLADWIAGDGDKGS